MKRKTKPTVIVGFLLIATLAALLLGRGCVPNRMYRDAQPQDFEGYRLMYIELDDQGELWSPEQLQATLDVISEANTNETGALAVLFVHGWHGNASRACEENKSGSLYGFKQVLDQLASDMQKSKGPKKSVVGVYFGWRGETSTVPGVRKLTFYSRLAAAERVAGTPATEAILRVAGEAKSKPESKVILLGHSMGGVIVERALSQALVGLVLGQQDPGPTFPIDLAILLNSAGKAIYSKQLVDCLERDRVRLYRTDDVGQQYERPLIVSITSAGDNATRLWFPIGMFFEGLKTAFRSYPDDEDLDGATQRRLCMTTSGHFPPLFSHTVAVSPLHDGEKDNEAGKGPFPYAAKQGEMQTDAQIKTGVRVFRNGYRQVEVGRKADGANDSPYWIMRVPEEIIPNHSRIYGGNAVQFVAALLKFSGALEPESRTLMVRETRTDSR